MDAISLFAQLARNFVGVLHSGAAVDLQERVLGVNASLAGLVAAASSLPVAPGRAPGMGPGLASDWPGLGSYENYWSVGILTHPGEPVPLKMSETLAFVHGQLMLGLEAFEADEVDTALSLWGQGFESGWGPAATELLLALQPIVAGYRSDLRQTLRQRSGPRTAGLVTLAAVDEPARPVASSLGAGPTVGVEFAPCPGGAEVVSVHAGGPAAGRLDPGDLVLSVDGDPVPEAEDEAVAMLRGVVGQAVRYEVFRRDGGTEVVVLTAVEGA